MRYLSGIHCHTPRADVPFAEHLLSTLGRGVSWLQNHVHVRVHVNNDRKVEDLLWESHPNIADTIWGNWHQILTMIRYLNIDPSQPPRCDIYIYIYMSISINIYIYIHIIYIYIYIYIYIHNIYIYIPHRIHVWYIYSYMLTFGIYWW